MSKLGFFFLNNEFINLFVNIITLTISCNFPFNFIPEKNENLDILEFISISGIVQDYYASCFQRTNQLSSENHRVYGVFRASGKCLFM